MYPNPTEGKVTLEMNAHGFLRLKGPLGKTLAEYKVHSGKNEIFLDVPEGIYFIHVVSDLGEKVQKILIE